MRFLALVIAALLAATPSVGAAGAAPVRDVISLAEGWRFHQGDVADGPQTPAFDDRGWERVDVPHTWNRVGLYQTGPAGRVNRADNIDKFQGVGWYRLAFSAPAGLKGRRAWLQFDAASRTAEVWLNGIRLGGHRGGFSRFRLDATSALRPGERNVLVVKTDNTPPAPGSPTADVLPLAGDFFVHGGLYRPVSLVATTPLHIEMMDFGGPGVYATTRSVEDGRAVLGVRTKLRNDGRAADAVVVARLLDAEGRLAAEATASLPLAAGAAGDVDQTLRVSDPRLWGGEADPYLYRLSVEVRSASGALLDRLDQPVGLRTIRIDAEEGLLLNGRPLQLHGVGLHQDLEGKGWAMTADDIARDVGMIREMGANTIRLTHYQHGQTVHDLADRYGLILWDEIPLVTRWTSSPGEKQASPALLENARLQLTELIRQNYNHPSVAVWGVANELDLLLGVAGGFGDGASPGDPRPMLENLVALARSEDPTRPTTLATCCEARGVENAPVTAIATDVAGHNRYFGWYYGEVDELGPHLDALRALRPGQPIAVSEYGGGGAVSMHTDDPRGGRPDSRGRAQPEEVESDIHERSWAILSGKPYLWSTWLWNMFDFSTTARREGDSEDINTKGLVTYDRKTRKDAFYFYKANWTAEPVVHINGRRYVDRAYAVTDVRVYSNASATELFLNGVSLGERRACPQRVCVWEDVRLRAGPNALVARGRFTRGAEQDAVSWALAPEAADAVRIDSGALLAATGPSGRFGSDAFFVGGGAGKVEDAATPSLLASFRKGDFRYRIPLRDGAYRITLSFVEPDAAPGARCFDVLVDGQEALSDLDVAGAAGGEMLPLTRSFPVRVSGGVLDLHFRPARGEAIVSAVEIVPEGGG